jgi:hypothetical protein
VVEACTNHRRVRIGYRSEAGSEWVTEVDPWAVVVRHGRWYLLCRSHTKDAPPTYRIDRVRTVLILDDTFSPPGDLDPVAMLEEHLAVGWEYDVEVVIDAPAGSVGRCLPRAPGRLEPLDARTTRLVGSTSNPWWYAEQLATIPASYRIVRCSELRQTARVVGQRLLAAGRRRATPLSCRKQCRACRSCRWNTAGRWLPESSEVGHHRSRTEAGGDHPEGPARPRLTERRPARPRLTERRPPNSADEGSG